MRELPLPVALTARLSPVVVLAAAGWALTSSPATPAGHHDAGQQTSATSPSAPPSTTGSSTKSYTAAPAPCGSVAVKTINALVPGARTAGKEIQSTDAKLRRTCSWNALKGYDYRWLDVSFEVMQSDQAAQKEYTNRLAQKSGGGAVPGLGDSAYSVVNLTTQDKQQTREGVVIARASNVLVVTTYNGSNFETKKAPSTDEINTGAIKAARDAVTALQGGRAG